MLDGLFKVPDRLEALSHDRLEALSHDRLEALSHVTGWKHYPTSAFWS